MQQLTSKVRLKNGLLDLTDSFWWSLVATARGRHWLYINSNLWKEVVYTLCPPDDQTKDAFNRINFFNNKFDLDAKHGQWNLRIDGQELRQLRSPNTSSGL